MESFIIPKHHQDNQINYSGVSTPGAISANKILVEEPEGKGSLGELMQIPVWKDNIRMDL
jgi:hypothetical protein